VLVAVSAVGLITITGLALDGGMEAGAYRHARNAADAGALAAARKIFFNAVSNPQGVSDVSTLTPVAQKDVTHNSAQFSSLTLGTQKVYAPETTGGATSQAALADMWATAGTILVPLDANLNIAGSQATAKMIVPASGGSTSSSQVDLGTVAVPTNLTNATFNCYTSTAHYTALADSYGTPTACAAGTTPVGVTATGTLLGTASTNTKVASDDTPSAMSRVQVTNMSGVDGTVSVTATSARSSTSQYFSPTKGYVSTAAVNAQTVHAATATMTLDASSLEMDVSLYVDPTTGRGTIAKHCTPSTMAMHSLVGGGSATVTVNSDCTTVGLSGLGINDVSSPYQSPSDDNDICSTDSSTGKVTCSVQLCMVYDTVNANPFNATLCLLEANATMSVIPITMSAYTGDVTVSATMPQSTYFLRVIGWQQTSPSASATAGPHPVTNVSDQDFANAPFAMPDTGTAMTSPFAYERLRPGHTYYLYGTSMYTYNPSVMGSGWQGQLSSSSPRAVGSTLQAAASTTTTPKTYQGSSYYLLPVFDPTTGIVEYYGVFAKVANQPWGTLVNSLPAQNGFLVQATTDSNFWNPYMEGAASVKLEQ